MSAKNELVNKIKTENKTDSWALWFDSVAPTYEKEYEEHPFWLLYNDITWDNIKKYLPESKDSLVLDAGGGTGFWSRKIAELGYKVTCVDISYGMLKQGEGRIKTTSLAGRIDFVQADITNMSMFPDRSFSLVIAQGDPISYCGKPEKAVIEIARVTEEEAYVIASVDSFFGALWRMFKTRNFQELNRLLENGDTIFQGKYLQHNFTIDELKTLFFRSGLEIISIIGKPIFTNAILWEEMREVLSDDDIKNKILELELKFNDNPSIAGLGNHLEIVGRKTRI